MLKIKKIFYTLQAEGTHSGLPSIFIRFAGCNLACDFCDTDFAGGNNMCINDILLELKKYPCNNVVITGGEPTAQAEGLKELIDVLHDEMYFVMIETNGTGKIEEHPLTFITVSPKDEVHHDNEGAQARSKRIIQTKVDDLKIVYTGQSSKHLLEYAAKFEVKSRRYLQPCSMNVAPVVEILKRISVPPFNNWYLSFQWHKTIGIE